LLDRDGAVQGICVELLPWPDVCAVFDNRQFSHHEAAPEVDLHFQQGKEFGNVRSRAAAG